MVEHKKSERYFEITYVTGEVVKVLAVPRSKLPDLIALQKSLLAAFLYQGALPGELLRPDNELVWGDIKRLSGMLSLVGGGELNLDLIEDCDRLVEVFFTTSTSRDPASGSIIPNEGERYYPSEISSLHGLNFFERLMEARNEAILMLERDKKLTTTTQPPSAQDQETPTPIPSPT